MSENYPANPYKDGQFTSEPKCRDRGQEPWNLPFFPIPVTLQANCQPGQWGNAGGQRQQARQAQHASI